MAANKTQGQQLTIFMVGITSACAGIAYLSSGMGKVALVVGIVLLALAFWKFYSIKSLEGKIALKSQPPLQKLMGLVVNIVGWLVVLLGIHLTPSVGGRMVAAILGLGISLVSIIIILPTACNKNAIWKA
jgi:hypothetical protein